MTNTGSWSIGNKTVQSLTIGNKEIQSIERVSDGAIIYQKEENNDLILKVTGTSFIANNQGNSYGLIGTDMVIDWGDGTSENLPSNTRFSHNYDENIIHTIRVTGVTGFNNITFYQNSNIIEITIPPTIESMGTGCCRGCVNLTTAKVYAQSIGNYLFEGCTNLNNITLYSEIIGASMFANCTQLTSIIIPNITTRISIQAFMGCTGLTSISIPNSVTRIDSQAFMGCTGLTSISIPNSVTNISYDANLFNNCSNLTDVQLYWDTPPVNYITRRGATAYYSFSNSNKIYYTIPKDTKSNYTAKGFPSAKLIERNE